jgi:periplasmic protein TonB
MTCSAPHFLAAGVPFSPAEEAPMAPSAIAEKPPVSHFTGAVPEIEILPLPARAPKKHAPEPEVPVQVNDLFNSALIEKNRMTTGSRTLDVLVSVMLHILVISVPILLSLYFTDTINLKQFTATLLVAPPPPPPPPPAAAPVVRVVPPRRVFMSQGKLVAPRYIPEQVAQIKEAPIPDADFGGVVGGVPGGVPGGQMNGVIGGVLGGVMSTAVALPAQPKPKAPVRVGGHIRQPKLLYRPELVYPTLAKQARVSGTVVIDAILDEQGNVVEMKIVSGPPLLYSGALGYLKQWKYEPTYLNDAPISIEMMVNIIFQLNSAQ